MSAPSAAARVAAPAESASAVRGASSVSKQAASDEGEEAREGEGEGEPAPRGDESQESTEATGASLLDRVRRGESEAMKELSEKPQMKRTVEDAVALASGRLVVKRREFEALEAELVKNPEALSEKDNLEAVRGYIDDRDTAVMALKMLAALPGELSADIIYDVWVGTRGRNDTTWLAEQLCHTETVRTKASQALQVALALRAAEECEPIRDLLPVVAEQGDQRASRLFAKLLKPGGCGAGGRDDCYACLRPLDRDKKKMGVRTVLSLVRGRRAPRVR